MGRSGAENGGQRKIQNVKIRQFFGLSFEFTIFDKFESEFHVLFESHFLPSSGIPNFLRTLNSGTLVLYK